VARPNRILIGALVIVVIGAGTAVFGWHIGSWFTHIWNTITLAMLIMFTMIVAAAYDIPVTFDTVTRVVAGNSIANMTAVTPGGAGVQRGFNVLSLKGVTSSANATSYSVAPSRRAATR
jgi:hypothetical protein